MNSSSTIAILALFYVCFIYSYVDALQLLVLLSLLYMLLPTAAKSTAETNQPEINAGLNADNPVKDIAELLNERLRFETGVNWEYVRWVMDQFHGDFNKAKAYVQKTQQKMVEQLTRILKHDLEPEMATALLICCQWNYHDAERLAINYKNWKLSVVRQCRKNKIDPSSPLYANEWYDFRRIDRTIGSLFQKHYEMRIRHENSTSCNIHVDIKMYQPTPTRHIRMKYSVKETLSDECNVGIGISFSWTDETNVGIGNNFVV